MNEDAIVGGCACGAVRYESEAAIEFSFHCYCRKCQRATGGGHSSAFALPLDKVKLTGELNYYEQEADTGSTTYAGFCPSCGSPILSKTARFPNRLYFHAATLDDPSSFKPDVAVFEEAAQPWDHVDQGLKSADR
ncbi:MAG: GFA family protein [Pseudomonadota bacterium]